MERMFQPRVELPEIAAGYIREMIVSQKIAPGDRIPSEIELMRQFGVSRSTIREAVKLLIAENVVEIQRGRGTFVSGQLGVGRDPLGLHFMDKKNLLRNLLETRLLMEPMIAVLATRRATKHNIAAIEAILLEFQHSPDPIADHARLDIKFHTAVAQSTQNDVLHRFLPIICDSITSGYSETVDIEGSHDRARKSHIEIFQAIRDGRPEDARRFTEEHIKSTANDANITLGGI